MHGQRRLPHLRMSAALLGTDGGSTTDDGSSSGSRSSSTGGGSGSTRSRSRSSRRGDLHYARLDPNASLCDRLLHPARVQICYLRRLAHAFTWGYVASVVGVYGVGQGIGGNYFLFAFDFFAADDLRISPSAAAQLYGLAYIPATLKALFGILSDAFPICGYHRTVYIVGYALLGTLGWLWVGLLSVDGSTSLGLVGVPLFMCNLGLWGPDVIIDATNAERVKTHPQLASDIQSLTWGSLAVFGIYAGLTQGLIQDAFGARGLFLAGSITGLAMMVPAMLGWLREERLPKSQRPRSVCHTFREVMGSAERAPVFQASFVVSFFSLFLGVFGVFYDSGESTETVKSAVVLVCTPLIAATAYLFLRKTDPTIAKIAAFVYLRAVCPTTKVMFYWYHAADYNGCSVAETDADRAQPLQFVLGDIERDATVLTFIGDDPPMPHEAAGAEDHNVFSAAGDTAERPCLSATYLGNLIIVKSLFAYFGTAAYNAYFSAREYHWLFRTGQMLVVAFNLVDLLWCGNGFFCSLFLQMTIICQDRLGTNTRTVEESCGSAGCGASILLLASLTSWSYCSLTQ